MKRTFDKTVEDLKDGDVFTPDRGKHWYVAAVVLFGDVAVYTSKRRDDDAPTIRIPLDRDATVVVIKDAVEATV